MDNFTNYNFQQTCSDDENNSRLDSFSQTLLCFRDIPTCRPVAFPSRHIFVHRECRSFPVFMPRVSQQITWTQSDPEHVQRFGANTKGIFRRNSRLALRAIYSELTPQISLKIESAIHNNHPYRFMMKTQFSVIGDMMKIRVTNCN